MQKFPNNILPATSGHGRASIPVAIFLVSVLPMLAQAGPKTLFLNTLHVRQGQAIQIHCDPSYLAVARNPFVGTVLGLEVSRVVKGKRTLIAEHFPFGDLRNGTTSNRAETGWHVACHGDTSRGKGHNNRFSIRLLVTKDASSLEDAGIYICSVHFALNKVLVKREAASMIRVTGENASGLMRTKRYIQMGSDDYYYYDYDYQDNLKLTGPQNNHTLSELEDACSRIRTSVSLVVLSALSVLTLTS